MMLTALVAVMAIGAVGATAASAATGHITTDIGSCDFIGTTGPDTSPPPWDHGVSVTGLAADPSGTCGVSGFSGDLQLNWNDAGPAEVSGDISAPGPFGTCSYSGTLTGTFGSGAFDLGTSPQTIPGGGAFLCPSSVDVIDTTTLTP